MVAFLRDMFLRRPASTFVARGPYRVLRDPMYGVGQLHAHGIALLISRSWNGWMAAAVCHGLIYVFYFTAELPFIQRTYLAPAPPRGGRLAATRTKSAPPPSTGTAGTGPAAPSSARSTFASVATGTTAT